MLNIVKINVLRTYIEVISTYSVSKSFAATKALSDIAIHVKAGQVYGFLRLNGARKTTLVRMLLGRKRRTDYCV